MQRRVLVGECTELRNMITERKFRIQQLQARYDVQMAALGTNPEDGTPLTATYLIIQSAQVKYILK